MTIVDRGIVHFGYQEVYFHEYFYEESHDKRHDKQRLVVRGIPVEVLDPVTKKPIPGKYEWLWTGGLAKDRTPYIVSKRARKKGKLPPKQYMPVPKWWIEENPKQWENYLEWLKQQRKKQAKSELEEKKIPFVLHKNTWMGPVHIRGLPREEWYLRLKIDKKILSFYLYHDPIHITPMPSFKEGYVPKKWFDYEGDVLPGERYNKTKELITKMTILDRGNVTYRREVKDGVETLYLNFEGKKLKGTWTLKQEEKDSPVYVFAYKEGLMLMEREFVYDKHTLHYKDRDSTHYDIRILYDDRMLEFNLWGDIRKQKKVPARKKWGEDITWMKGRLNKEYKRKAYGIDSTFVHLDRGTVTIHELTDKFVSMTFNGKIIKGYYIYRKDKEPVFMKSELPEPLEEPKLLKPFKVTGVPKQPELYRLHLYDHRDFTKCVDYKKYLPDLKLPDYVTDVILCQYYVPGTLPHLKVQSVIVKKDTPKTQVIEWIKQNKLHTFDAIQIRD